MICLANKGENINPMDKTTGRTDIAAGTPCLITAKVQRSD